MSFNGDSRRSANSEPTEPAAASVTSFDYLYFAQFLAFRNVNIIPYDDLHPSGLCQRDESEITDREMQAGQGANTSVLFRRLNNQLVAVKLPKDVNHENASESNDDSLLSRYEGLVKTISFEVQVMSHKPLCNHPNIVKLIGLSFLEMIPVPVVEAAIPEHPDLKAYMESSRRLRPLPITLLYQFISDIADGISALHDFGVIHGDVKPENILIFKNGDGIIAKLGDFGSSGIRITKNWPTAWSPPWVPPDYHIYSDDARQSSLDIYAFGRVGIYLATEGAMPADSKAISQDVVSKFIQDIRSENLETLLTILKHALELETFQRTNDISNTRSLLLGWYPHSYLADLVLLYRWERTSLFHFPKASLNL
jgi:serine/threonine protein kinase